MELAFRSGKGHVQSGTPEHYRHDTGHRDDETFRTFSQIRERVQQTNGCRRSAGRRAGEWKRPTRCIHTCCNLYVLSSR